jgi:hypothetical protein
MVKEILLTLFYLLLFNFLILRFPKLQFKNFKPVVTPILFNLKFITGIFIWSIYTFYYKDVQNNDVHKFYNDAIVLRNVASQSPKDFIQIVSGIGSNEPRFDKYYAEMKNWKRNFDEAPFNENQTIIKLNALLMFVSLRVYFVHILFMCFISLIGWVLLTNAILKFAPAANSIFAIPIMLLPSVLFWTSGVIKEPLLVLGLGVFIYGLLYFENGNKRKNLSAVALMLAGAFIIVLIKFFVLACLIPAVIAFLVLRQNQNTATIFLKYLVINVLLLACAFNINRLIPRINLQQMLVNKQTHSVKEAEYFNAGSRIEIPGFDNNAGSILKTAPIGIWNTIARPYLWEGKNIMMLASAVENVLIMLFIILCLWLSDFKNFRQLNLLLFLLNFSLAYFALIGICTPVLGNLVRYRAPLLPILLFAFVLLIRSDAVPGKLNTLVLNK